jgi:hypothetical protein
MDWGEVAAQRTTPLLYIFDCDSNLLPTCWCPKTEKEVDPVVEPLMYLGDKRVFQDLSAAVSILQFGL